MIQNEGIQFYLTREILCHNKDMWLSLNQDGRELNEHTSSPPQNPFEKDK